MATGRWSPGRRRRGQPGCTGFCLPGEHPVAVGTGGRAGSSSGSSPAARGRATHEGSAPIADRRAGDSSAKLVRQRTRSARRRSCAASDSAGWPSGAPSNADPGDPPPLPASRSAALIASQFWVTSSAPETVTSPNTCGSCAPAWRRAIGHVVDRVAGAVGALGRDPGVERHLGQDVAELLPQRRLVSALQRVQRLVALLQQVRGERGVRLLRVPGTVGAQPVHHGNQPQQASAWLCRTGRCRAGPCRATAARVAHRHPQQAGFSCGVADGEAAGFGVGPVADSTAGAGMIEYRA